MPFFGQSRGKGLSTIRPRVLKTGDKMGLPWDAYYVLTKANAALTNSKVHPNSGAPDYNITHNLSDLVIDVDLELGAHDLYIGTEDGHDPSIYFISDGADGRMWYEDVGDRFNFDHGIDVDGTITVDDLRTDSWRADAGDFINYDSDNDEWNIIIDDVTIGTFSDTGLDVTDLSIGGSDIDGLYLAIDGSNANTDIDIGAYDLKATSFTIGANTLTTTEFGFLDEQDQSVKIASSPQFAGLGIGLPANPDYGIAMTKTTNAMIAAGIYGQVSSTRTTVIFSYLYGLNFATYWTPLTLTANNSRLVNLLSVFPTVSVTMPEDSSKTMTITKLSVFEPQMIQLNNGTSATKGLLSATSLYIYKTTNPSLVNGASITTLYGFYDVGMTTGTTSWGFYGLSAQNLLSGKLRIGSTDAPTVPLDVVGNTKIDGISYLGDGGTTNYMQVSAAGVLRPYGSATYQSTDGSAGWNGTFLNAAGATVTVKDGLITGVA